MTFWDAFWLLAIWVPLILLWGFALVDLFRSAHSGIAKALWAVSIIFLPVIGVILYFALRPVRQNQYAVNAPGQTGPDSDTADSIARLHDLNQRGILDDAEFAKYKTYIVR
jgi:Phospholipase_D-nuclease N-terminal